MMRALRYVLAALSLVAALSLMLAALPVPRSTPLRPSTTRSLALEDFVSPNAELRPSAGGLEIRSVGAGSQRLLMVETAAFVATEYRYLDFVFGELSPALRPVLWWRSDGQTRTTPVPWSRSGGRVDLQRLEAWTGSVDALGLMVVPVELAPAQLSLDEPAVLARIELESASWLGAVRALLAEWMAYRPWMGRSINTGGFESAWQPSLPLGPSLLGIALALSVGLALITKPGRRLPVIAAVLAATWVLLDISELRQWRARSVEAQHLARDAAQAQIILSAQPALEAALQPVTKILAALPAGTRVLVHSPTRFLAEYPLFLLREFDVGLVSAEQVPEAGAVLVLVNAADWHFDAQSAALTTPTGVRRVRPLLAGGAVQVYELQAETAP